MKQVFKDILVHDFKMEDFQKSELTIDYASTEDHCVEVTWIKRNGILMILEVSNITP